MKNIKMKSPVPTVAQKCNFFLHIATIFYKLSLLSTSNNFFLQHGDFFLQITTFFYNIATFFLQIATIFYKSLLFSTNHNFFYTILNLFYTSLELFPTNCNLFQGMSESLVWINEKSVISHVISIPYVSRG